MPGRQSRPQENFTKVLQLHGGVAWKNLGARKLTAQFEVRFSRDFGFRRLISRNLYRNTTNAYDGVTARVGSATWNAQLLVTRPVFYTYLVVERDPRFNRMRFRGLYVSNTARRAANIDAYALVWRDGGAMPLADRRSLETVGARMSGTFGPGRRAEYEIEAAGQVGTVGVRDHKAWFEHAQVGWNFTGAPARPRVLALFDYASGDPDPTDARSGAFDALLGARRFEFGPVGLYNIIGRTNLVSPAVWVITRPTAALETSLQIRGVWLDQARDQWRPVGLGDPTGRAGRHVGMHAEWRTRYRLSKHMDFDGAVTVFRDGAFVDTLRPTPQGRAVHLLAGLEVKY